METTYLDCSWGSACVCKLVGCIIIWKEEGPLHESVEVFGKQAAATRVGLGKEAKYGGFWQFHFAIFQFNTKGSGQTDTCEQEQKLELFIVKAGRDVIFAEQDKL